MTLNFVIANIRELSWFLDTPNPPAKGAQVSIVHNCGLAISKNLKYLTIRLDLEMKTPPSRSVKMQYSILGTFPIKQSDGIVELTPDKLKAKITNAQAVALMAGYLVYTMQGVHLVRSVGTPYSGYVIANANLEHLREQFERSILDFSPEPDDVTADSFLKPKGSSKSPRAKR